jgi:repressor LexA
MMTPRMRKTMLYVQDLVDATGVPPTLDEICEHLEMSSRSGAHRIVSSLVERGYLRRVRQARRGIVIRQRVEPMFAAFVFDDDAKEFRRWR